jgi:hypothetical protein
MHCSPLLLRIEPSHARQLQRPVLESRRRRKESATASVSVIERDVKGTARERGSESESETEIATGGDATGPGHEIAADIAADKLGCIYHKHLLLSINDYS